MNSVLPATAAGLTVTVRSVQRTGALVRLRGVLAGETPVDIELPADRPGRRRLPGGRAAQGGPYGGGCSASPDSDAPRQPAGSWVYSAPHMPLVSWNSNSPSPSSRPRSRSWATRATARRSTSPRSWRGCTESRQLTTTIFASLTPWQITQLARHPLRPYTLDYIRLICDEFTELHGDRMFGDDMAIVEGLARIDGKPLMIIGHQKGRDTKEACPPQPRHAQARGLSQGAAPAEDRRALRTAGAHAGRHHGCVSRRVERGARRRAKPSRATSSRWRRWKCPSSAP